MSEDEIAALISQFRKMTGLVKKKASDVVAYERERKILEALIKTVLGHRGPGYEITQEEALERAAVMHEAREASIKAGVPEPPLGETIALADQLMKIQPAPKN